MSDMKMWHNTAGAENARHAKYGKPKVQKHALDFLPSDALLSAVYAVVVCLSVCVRLSVCHTPVLYQNG